jgi:hypothetical protein
MQARFERFQDLMLAASLSRRTGTGKPNFSLYSALSRSRPIVFFGRQAIEARARLLARRCSLQCGPACPDRDARAAAPVALRATLRLHRPVHPAHRSSNESNGRFSTPVPPPTASPRTHGRFAATNCVRDPSHSAQNRRYRLRRRLRASSPPPQCEQGRQHSLRFLRLCAVAASGLPGGPDHDKVGGSCPA